MAKYVPSTIYCRLAIVRSNVCGSFRTQETRTKMTNDAKQFQELISRRWPEICPNVTSFIVRISFHVCTLSSLGVLIDLILSDVSLFLIEILYFPPFVTQFACHYGYNFDTNLRCWS